MKVTNVQISNDCALISVNPKVYPLDAIYSASYVFLDRAYILLDGDPKKVITIEIKPKSNKRDAEKFAREFMNELINYSDYKERAKSTKEIREILLQRALITNDPSLINIDDSELQEILKDEDYVEDPEGIAIPWEEKYGKKGNKGKVKQKSI